MWMESAQFLPADISDLLMLTVLNISTNIQVAICYFCYDSSVNQFARYVKLYQSVFVYGFNHQDIDLLYFVLRTSVALCGRNLPNCYR